MGSGNFIYFVQMHFIDESNSWAEVWETGFGNVVDVEFLDKDGELNITYLKNKFSKEKDASKFKLRWGGR